MLFTIWKGISWSKLFPTIKDLFILYFIHDWKKHIGLLYPKFHANQSFCFQVWWTKTISLVHCNSIKTPENEIKNATNWTPIHISRVRPIAKIEMICKNPLAHHDHWCKSLKFEGVHGCMKKWITEYPIVFTFV